MIKLMAIGLALCAILSVEMASAGQGGKQKPVVVAAEDWLKLVDDGKFAESWKEAAEYFKGMVNQSQWEQSIQSVRVPLGAVISRRLKAKNFATSLPGAPDGEYVVIQFATSFENKTSAVETITPMMDKDGQWRVSGYYIK
jgi:hypothetical protein